MQFLLERLAATPSLSMGQPEPFDMEAAVAAQIQRIVSSRIVAAPDGDISLIEFGMPSVVELAQNSRAQLERYAAQLVRLIEHYEPRLRHPGVAVEPGRDALHPYRLVVSGWLAPDSEIATFRFELPAH